MAVAVPISAAMEPMRIASPAGPAVAAPTVPPAQAAAKVAIAARGIFGLSNSFLPGSIREALDDRMERGPGKSGLSLAACGTG